jgi:hypothetical protein
MARAVKPWPSFFHDTDLFFISSTLYRELTGLDVGNNGTRYFIQDVISWIRYKWSIDWMIYCLPVGVPATINQIKEVYIPMVQ